MREPNWPQRTTQVANSFSNQFELPVLFYVLTILAYMTHQAGLVFVVLAWIFVIFRLLSRLCPRHQQRRADARLPLWGRGRSRFRSIG